MPSARRLYSGQLAGAVAEPSASPATPSSVGSATADAAPWPSLEAHAANRLMFGPRPGDLQTIQQLGYSDFLNQQVWGDTLEDGDCDARLAALSLNTLNESPAQLYDRRNGNWDEVIRPLREVKHATWIRMLYSRRQLLERVVEFWHNHFSIDSSMYIIRSMLPSWDAWLRQNAFGNFRTLLEGTTAHPCMLYYLDNYISTDGGPNENYTREMIELHTLGSMNYQVEGGYFDQDVYEASRCFTGWSFEQSGASANRGQFKYNHDDHDRFIKLVFGQILPGDQPPLRDGRDVLDKVAFHPGTARHIAWKLCVRFIDDNPPQSIVNSAAESFMAKKDDIYQIRWTIHHILSSQEFLDTRMTKFKRPVDWIASVMRATDMPYSTSSTFDSLYNNLGMPMFGWRSPDGPPDYTSYWATSNSLLQRWNWLLRIVSGWYSSSDLNLPTTMPGNLDSPDAVAQYFADRILGRPASGATMDALREFVAEGRGWNLAMPGEQVQDKRPFAAALACMTPEFMRR
jgi:uncharacterized protein (DUF1800 family)